MILAVFIAIVIAGLLFIGMPLFRPAPVHEVPVDAPARDDLAVDKALSALNEIEYDYQMNKLSEEDYRELHNRYSRKAIQVLRDVEAGTYVDPDLAGGEAQFDLEMAEAEAELELALAEAEAEAEADAEAEVEAALAEALAEEEGAPLSCPACGAVALTLDQAFCHRCGSRLEGVLVP